MSITIPPCGTYEELVRTLVELISPLHDLQRQKAPAYAPIVQTLIHNHSRNVNEIERTLDHLLDCACIPEGLTLFKSLCRYYYGINPANTAYYVHAYREMWDSEETLQQEGES